MTHNDVTCNKYNDVALPDEKGNCSLCGVRMAPWNGFAITTLNFEDLEGRFTPEERAKLTTSDLRWIASQMADAYLGGQFWDDLDYFVRELLNKIEM